ncbi:unnamed protein product [Arctia plantaginis]|uniref:NACHT domain-containing protein n=1 Tax=Arctia plantaginis TaxID=874455 RepID=A0A8S0ZFE9_ARCPL|nr:unnamed protein product [Arctia plantaginis]
MDVVYKKRFGTSGISGQLYETKLISLILFRLLHDDSVEEFYLASNMDEIGSFDDICLKMKIVGQSRPIVLFIQVKHRDNDDKFLTLDNKNDAVKWSDSILKIKKKINSNKSNDKLFSGDIDETEYVFVLYTNANCDFDSHDEFESDYASCLNNLIATSATVGSRPLYNEKDIEEFGEKILKEEIAILVERFAKFLGDKTNQTMNIMNDEYILRYHVILSQKIVNVSKIQTEDDTHESKWRTLTFRKEFFNSDDEYVALFRYYLYEQILKNQVKTRRQNSGPEKKPALDRSMSEPNAFTEKLITVFLSEPTAEALSPLIENQITFNKMGKLEFFTERPVNQAKKISQINVSQSTIDLAKEIAAKTKLLSLQLKVPVAFGNIDLAISGGQKKIERRLHHLTDVIVGLCLNSTQNESNHKIVRIDDTIDSGLLSANGGLATTVGNILTYDDNTNLLKFADDYTLLQDNAKSLYLKLNHKIENLHEYRFEVNTTKFPKLSFDCANIAREFLSKLVIYTKQSNHYEVEDILKKDIQKYLSADPRNCPVSADSVFLYYHNVIQKWWMSPKTGPYLTKTSDIFVQAINNTVVEPQLSALQNTFYMTNIKYFGCNFTENTLKSFKLSDVFSTIILVTDITALTAIKVIQCLRNTYFSNKYTVLDFECVLNLPTTAFCALDAELRKTEKIIIMVFDNTHVSGGLRIRLYELSQAMKEKQVIMITNKALIKVIKECFTNSEVVHDETQSLNALTPESRQDIIKNARVIFQGKEISLEVVADDESVAFIKGPVLNKIIRNEPISLGTSLSNSNYEEIKDLYVDRRVSQSTDDAYGETDYDNVRFVKTFRDIDDDAVLITAAPGMGKSTLLTHLSLKTKDLDEKLWVVRINLLDYSKEFYRWQENKTNVNTVEMLKFMCHVILKNNNISIDLKEENNKMYLDNCINDEWVLFELNMFLHFYNERKLMFLFDGFDEICPHYKENVIKFFEVVRNFPQKNKMWVTSRPYSDILPDLHRALGKSYKLEHMSDSEQAIYLKSIWRLKLIFGKLNEVQLKNISTYMTFISEIMSSMYSPDALHFRFRKIYYIFFEFVKSHFPHIITRRGYPSYRDRNIIYHTLPEERGAPKAMMVEILSDDQRPSVENTEVDTLLGTPLLLYFIAEYFLQVIDTSESITKWQLGMNILSIYEMFIESKLKKVLFQDKNKMDVYNPDIMSKFEKERAECVMLHKKIATYVLLGSPIFNGLMLDEFKEMDPLYEGGLEEFNSIINTIKTGAEKTGLISHVTADDVPVFIHRTFTEYFAAEFICDILKSNKYEFEKKKLLYTTTHICHKNDVFPWISKKKEMDEDLKGIIRKIEDTNPLLLTWYKNFMATANWPLELYIRIMNSSQEDYEKDYINQFNEHYAYIVLYKLQPKDREVALKKFQKNLIVKMRPHLRKFFAPICSAGKKSWLRRAISYNL